MTASLPDTLTTLGQRIAALVAAHTAAVEEVATLREHRDAAVTQWERCREENATLRLENEDLRTQRVDAKHMIERANETVLALRETVEAQRSEIARLQREVSRMPVVA